MPLDAVFFRRCLNRFGRPTGSIGFLRPQASPWFCTQNAAPPFRRSFSSTGDSAEPGVLDEEVTEWLTEKETQAPQTENGVSKSGHVLSIFFEASPDSKRSPIREHQSLALLETADPNNVKCVLIPMLANDGGIRVFCRTARSRAEASVGPACG